MSARGIIKAEPESRCELCNAIAECRPYGPRGESVCFPCAMKDEAAAVRQFFGHVHGELDS